MTQSQGGSILREDRIISVLIGLVGACNNNPKTENTDGLMIKSLAFPLIYPDFGDDEISELINEIRSEKNAIAPGCAVCTSPCGNTSDYDMNRIYNADDGIGGIKLQILSKIQKLAAHEYLCRKNGEKSETKIRFFYKALSLISYDLEKDTLLGLLEETENIESSIVKKRKES